MLSRQVAPLLPKFRKVSAYFTIANLDPSRRKYGSRVQCRVGDRSHHRNRDGLRSNFHLLAFARVILKFFCLGHALYCLLPIACHGWNRGGFRPMSGWESPSLPEWMKF